VFLHKIKLAGFKSFVDPTTIVLPSNLIGIVGPNGCGKSNVADAVRWVMGEISAKHLRGDSMADVVFNGSTARKPVGQASVEILLHNAEKRLGGRFANYNEISIRRLVTREGKSHYFLNGKRCRRRDVTDVFLGTGLGPHSYAIIEQGMISRLVEAKPDELREFLEEAAGVSKYKERRRETENRIARTRENLTRLQDLRDELAKRLQYLKRQATTAEKYRALKQTERLTRAQLLTLRWRILAEELVQQDQRIHEQEMAMETQVAEQRHLESLLNEKRTEHTAALTTFNDNYRSVLDVGAEIARGEETIGNLRNHATQISQTLQKEEENLQEARDHLEAERQKINTLEKKLSHEKPESKKLEQQVTEAAADHAKAEKTMQEWSSSWEGFSLRVAQTTQAVQGKKSHIEQLKERLSHANKRYTQLEEEQNKLDADGLQREITSLTHQLAKQNTARIEAESQHTRHQVVVQDLRQRTQELSSALNVARERAQEARGRLSSLMTLQQEALGKRQGAVTDWLRENALMDLPRLAEELEVTAGWERAIENVLGTTLRAVCVGGLETPVSTLDTLQEGTLTLFDTTENTGGNAKTLPTDHTIGKENNTLPNGTIEKEKDPPFLNDKVTAPWPMDTLLSGVRTENTLHKALALRMSLYPEESIVTPNGEWIGRNWIRIHRGSDSAAGVLSREREIKTLIDRIDTLQKEIQDWERAMETAHQERKIAEKEERASQTKITEAERLHITLKSRLVEKQTRLDETNQRSRTIIRELGELDEQRYQTEENLTKMQKDLGEQQTLLNRLTAGRDTQISKRKEHQEHLTTSRDRWQQIRDKAHRMDLEVASTRTQYRSLTEAQTRNNEQVSRLDERCKEFRKSLLEMDAPLQNAKSELTRHQARRQELETIMQNARQRVEKLDQAVRDSDQKRHAIADRIDSGRNVLERERLARQETHVRREAIEEQIIASGYEVESLLAELPKEAEETGWEGKIRTLEQQISRLGPINLVAVQEHEQQSKEKEHLDAQNQDLVDALETLETAIRNMDRETRARFTDTFERVNTKLGTLFPRLFGGGNAHLELTGSDPLTAGVTVMARPPGKRNSIIALLSGGEKALTAVVMIFALFELNPAPFCLLDEVDAPLDDANVHRFRDLVKEMSERIQFLLITHNKNTMEIAHQLVGVTMSEPGVSRLVSVDVEETLANLKENLEDHDTEIE